MVTFVEHNSGGFQWADPLTRGAGLDVKLVGSCLQIVGLLPLHTSTNDCACDVFQQYQTARKDFSIGKGRTGKDSPHIRFANADTDEKLVAFVKQFGPVVARSVYDNFERPEKDLPEPRWPLRLTAEQEINELRSERLLYHFALKLVIELGQPEANGSMIQNCIKEISDKVSDWPRQWEREQQLGQSQIFWKISPESVERIQHLSTAHPDPFFSRRLDGHIVICELLNAFRSVVFPNLAEFHRSIRFGIRPLLYSILRREVLYPRDTGICANSQCREFFEIERAGQRFCCETCSIRQRQRDYWKKSGKKLRGKRLKKVRGSRTARD
jgi:hypothetical protein